MTEFTVPEDLQGIDEKVLTEFVREHPLSKNWQREIAAERKRAEAAETEATKLKTDYRSSTAEAILDGLGVPKSRAKYIPADLELTKETVQEWAVAEEFLVKPTEEAPAERPTFVTPTVQGTTPGPQKMSRQDFDKLMLANPREAMTIPKDRIEWKHEV